MPQSIPSSTSTIVAIPVPGQLVDVRRRRHVVVDVEQTTQPVSILHSSLPGTSGVARSQGQHHIVTLSSVEDVGLGTQIEVVWEREVGARILERPAMPFPGLAPGEPFDTPQVFDTFLNCVRWGALSDANRDQLQSPLRSGIETQDYQLDPVARALKMPRVSLLIADDVGLGKTIEAGLVAQELLLRARARRVLIVCPADIQIQWQSEMREKFGLEFRIIDAEAMRLLRRTRGLHVNPWTHFPRLITSMDYLKRDRPLQWFRETLPGEGESAFPRRYDLLIVDEAHNVAPSGSGHYALDSARTKAIRAITPHFEHKLFLSATPHNGFPESFSALLELLDSQRFARGVTPNRDQLGRVLVRRLKSEIKNWDGTSRFPSRELRHIELAYSDTERQLHRDLRLYTQSRIEGASSDAETLASQWVLKLLKKRLFSSPQAFFDTLEKHRTTLRGKREQKAPRRFEAGILRRQIEETDDATDSFDNDQEWEESLAETLDTSSRLFREPSAQENALLDRMQKDAGALCAGDSKSRALIAWLKSELLDENGAWNGRRAIIFTEYRATQKWLHSLLSVANLAEKGRLEIIYGGMDGDERERIKNAFQAHPDASPVRILLATDAASEGINLQNHCSRLVHYEIPWNPNRMEQRNGRVDRHGQRDNPVQIFHFVGAGFDERNHEGRNPGDLEGDLEFLFRAARKVNQIREDLGKVGPVIASQVEAAMLGKRRSLDTARAENEAAPLRQLLKFERDLRKQLVELADELRATRDTLHLSPQTLERAVLEGLRLAQQPPLQKVEVTGLAAPAFEVPNLTGSFAGALVGLEHPHTRKRRPLCFDAGACEGRDDVVLAHLNHRLVALCTSLVRAEVWSLGASGGGEDLNLRRAKINRATVRPLSGGRFGNPIVIAHARLVVLGGDNGRLHEELFAAGGHIREGRFSRFTSQAELEAALNAKGEGPVAPAIQQTLLGLWPRLENPLLDALDKRKEERAASLERFLQNRAQTESEHLRAVMEELQRSIQGELSDQGPQQLQLWSDEEREQLGRNRDSLQRRLSQIPEEIERETSAITARYASPQARIFPAAVEFLVPSNLR